MAKNSSSLSTSEPLQQEATAPEKFRLTNTKLWQIPVDLKSGLTTMVAPRSRSTIVLSTDLPEVLPVGVKKIPF